MEKSDPPALVGLSEGLGVTVPKRAGLRGFGVTITRGGGARNWYAGADGVKRWANNDQPCTPLPDDGDRFRCAECGHTWNAIDDTERPRDECPVCGETPNAAMGKSLKPAPPEHAHPT